MPGNYPTALPQRQDREITDKEELLAQTFKREGGVNYFTGMNDMGISFAGNKKVAQLQVKKRYLTHQSEL